MVPREKILEEIRRLAAENDGKPAKSDWFLLTPADVKAFKRWTKIY
jgi:hypothetical protein